MDPELSITMPMATGMSSRRKAVIFWGWPSSKTVKELRSRSVTRWCLSSTTVACSVTSSTSLRKTKTSPLFSAGACPRSAEGADSTGLDCGGAVAVCPTVSVPRKIKTTVRTKKLLLRGCIVSRFGVNVQRRQALRRIQSHFDLSPLAIPRGISGTISEDVLVTQFNSDLGSHVAQFVGVSDGEGTAACDIRDLSQQLGTFALLRSLEVSVIEANTVNLHIRLLDHRLDFGFGVAAMVVAAVGDDEECLLLVLGLAHAVHAQIDGVQQCGPAFWSGIHQLALDVFDGGREVGEHLWLFGKGDKEELIFGIGGLEEFHDRIARFIDLVGHRTADIEDHAQRYGSVLAGKVLDLLRLATVAEEKIVLLQPGHEPVHGVGDGHWHQYQVNVFADGLGVGFKRRIHRNSRRLGLGCNCRWHDGWVGLSVLLLFARNYVNVRLFVLGKCGHGGAHAEKQHCNRHGETATQAQQGIDGMGGKTSRRTEVNPGPNHRAG